jgi:hypothetical protein
MRRVSVLALVALATAVLPACDAGHRGDPGVDNRQAGPALAIVQPAPGQTFALEVRAEDGQAIGRWPALLFDLRHMAPREKKAGDHVRYVLDHGPVQVVPAEGLARPVHVGLEAPKGPGTHVLRAWAARADGTPYGNAESVAVRRFHLGEESGDFDVRMPPGSENPLGPFRETDPHLVVAAPAEGEAGERLQLAVSGEELGADLRVLLRTGDREAAAPGGGAVDLRALAPFAELPAGEHEVEIRLQRRDGTEWKDLPGPFNVARRTLRLR